MSNNIFKHEFEIGRNDREKQNNQKAFLIWFTGLSGSGKSTLANALEKRLVQQGYHTYLLDGDNVRKGINSDLGFSPQDREENIRRIAEVAKLMIDAGLIVLASFVSPYRVDRARAKAIVGSDDFIELFVDTPLEECERRDTKGLYKKARQGVIKNFTGIGAPYEAPEHPDITIDTTQMDVEQAIDWIVEAIQPNLKRQHHE